MTEFARTILRGPNVRNHGHAALKYLSTRQIAGVTRFVFSAANDFTLARQLADAHPEIVNPARIVAE